MFDLFFFCVRVYNEWALDPLASELIRTDKKRGKKTAKHAGRPLTAQKAS